MNSAWGSNTTIQTFSQAEKKTHQVLDIQPILGVYHVYTPSISSISFYHIEAVNHTQFYIIGVYDLFYSTFCPMKYTESDVIWYKKLLYSLAS